MIESEITRTGDAHIVSLTGAVTSRASGYVMDWLIACTKTGSTLLVVDMTGVTTLTRAGLRGFVVAAILMRTNGGSFCIYGGSPDDERLLKESGFGYLMTFAATREDALAGQVTPGPRRGQVPRNPFWADHKTATRPHASNYGERPAIRRLRNTGGTNAA